MIGVGCMSGSVWRITKNKKRGISLDALRCRVEKWGHKNPEWFFQLHSYLRKHGLVIHMVKPGNWLKGHRYVPRIYGFGDPPRGLKHVIVVHRGRVVFDTFDDYKFKQTAKHIITFYVYRWPPKKDHRPETARVKKHRMRRLH